MLDGKKIMDIMGNRGFEICRIQKFPKIQLFRPYSLRVPSAAIPKSDVIRVWINKIFEETCGAG
jgi:hypothetical protein